TRFFFQTQDQVWRPLDPIPGRPGMFCIPRQAVLTNQIKVSAADLARNPTTRTYNLGELAQGSRGAAPAPQLTANAPSPYEQSLPSIPPYVPKEIPPAPPSRPRTQTTYPSTANQMPIITTPATSILPVTGSDGNRTPHDVNPQVRQAGAVHPPVGRPDPMMRPGTANEASAATSAGTLSRQQAAPTQIVGNATVFLNYEIENQGASGVGKIEIWATSDQCRTWVKMVDDTTRKNPAEIHFPGEGVFGLKLVASNGRGYGAEPPQSGDPADSWIEVDTTKPTAAITAVQAGIGPESGILTVFWKAEDKNLAADGIDLYFAATAEGPWSPIAKNIHNEKGIEGQYRWTPPRQAGAETYLRLVVRDRAGNSSVSQTVQPIPLDDLSRPRVRLVNVTTLAQPATVAPASLSAPAALRSGIVRPVQATSVPDLSPPPPPSAGPNLVGVESR
ncbi:MAG TPA: hypothetical protein VHR72_03005, partial [Gemmataceae bacterium]|nr:hypothetical protein [Gemmataceae bacterium]